MKKEKNAKREDPMKGDEPTDRNFQKTEAADKKEENVAKKEDTDNTKKEDTAGIP